MGHVTNLGVVFPHLNALDCVSSKCGSITGLQTCLQRTARHGESWLQNGDKGTSQVPC